jgi:anti-sigma factor RsiW
MNCEEVQKYLSDFLDKSLDVARARAIEDHLAACSRCSEEMASLAECQRLVSDLPVVAPPVDFTTRVMAAVREAGRPPSFWERLFLPFRSGFRCKLRLWF